MAEVPEQASFDLTLDKIAGGEGSEKPVLKNPVCKYSYRWDFKTNMGLAHLNSINGTLVDITLHPLGIAGELDFMSDMKPTKYEVNATNDQSIALVSVTISRVILDIKLSTGERSGAIMFNTKDGYVIQASKGLTDASPLLRAQNEVTSEPRK